MLKRTKKFTVNLDPETYARIGREKYDTGLKIEEIVNRRLRLSFEVVPTLEPEAVGA